MMAQLHLAPSEADEAETSCGLSVGWILAETVDDITTDKRELLTANFVCPKCYDAVKGEHK